LERFIVQLRRLIPQCRTCHDRFTKCMINPDIGSTVDLCNA